MSPKNRFSKRPWIAALTLVMVAGFTVLISGQQRGRMADPTNSLQVPILSHGPERSVELRGIVEDWTTHHVAFSDPGTEDDAIREGRYEEWLRIVNDPRYITQQLKRRSPARGPAADFVARMNEAALQQETGRGEPMGVEKLRDLSQLGSVLATKSKKQPIHRDWNESLGVTTAQSYLSYPAKWSFSTTTASCGSDYVVFPTGGSTSQASIIAYYNLYSGCTTGTVPEVDWAYNTGGTVTLAPVLYYLGSQLAVIQSSSSVASLVLVRYPNTPPGTGTLAGPITPAPESASNYIGCTAPCMTSITLNGSPNDLTSDPYYDWGTDSLYVGDSAGKLHKFTPVFTGVPAEVMSSGWPLTVGTTAVSSPVYDAASACVFVGDTVSGSAGGYLYSVYSGNSGSVCTSSTASKHGTSGRLDQTYGVRDAPLVDSTAKMVYVFAGDDASGNDGVFQFPTSFTSGSGTEATLGSGATGATAYQLAGTFDNTYYTSSSSTSPSGNIYVCGTTAAAPLYQIPISGNVMGTPVTGPTVSSSSYYGRCSPVSEFFNTSAPVTATGSVTIASSPGGWTFNSSNIGPTVTIGATTYTFVDATPSAADQVEVVTSHSSGTNETDTAANLAAAVNANSNCNTPSGSGCYGSGTTANASVSATPSSHVVTLTAKTAGTSGNFTLNSSNTGDISYSGGNNGSNGTDYIFLSVYYGTQSGCTQNAADGCVMSFNVSTPSNFSSSLTSLGAMNLSAATTASPTGGLIVDNEATSPTGASEIYFQLTDTGGTTPCSSGSNCAVQASQAGP